MKNNIGDTVFISVSEEIWGKPFPRKIYHNPEIRTVILRCKILHIRGDEFKAKLFDNNGFEKDGEVFVFNKLILLENQDFSNFELLGVWKNHTSL